MATAANALGMKIVVSERPGKDTRNGRVKFEEVLLTSDYISLHCPLNVSTSKLMNSTTFALMKNDAFLMKNVHF